MTFQVRYDPVKEIYRDCRFCQGKGCIHCPVEADNAYKAEFPGGPVPIATFDITTPDGVAAARRSIGAEAITKAFGPGGGGMAEVVANVSKEPSATHDANAIRALLATYADTHDAPWIPVFAKLNAGMTYLGHAASHAAATGIGLVKEVTCEKCSVGVIDGQRFYLLH